MERKLTVSSRGGLVVQVVAQDGGGLVEQACDFLVRPAVEDLGEQVCVVAAAGGDELLLCRGALHISFVRNV